MDIILLKYLERKNPVSALFDRDGIDSLSLGLFSWCPGYAPASGSVAAVSCARAICSPETSPVVVSTKNHFMKTFGAASLRLGEGFPAVSVVRSLTESAQPQGKLFRAGYRRCGGLWSGEGEPVRSSGREGSKTSAADTAGTG